MEEVIFKMKAKIDTISTAEIEQELKKILDSGVMYLVLDMKDTKYISSVGLRMLLTAQKTMNARKGTMLLRGVQDQVKEIFDVTGFSGFLMLED